ncbi:MAG TPA: 2-oxoacid:acceptor oxidoreductase subunit alpha [Candidatus Limnocylindria bacterium]|nr:2-oxoacid:acceptor oxidoreductase subunit alpha [Candidatus Limnocylindria bacterium]
MPDSVSAAPKPIETRESVVIRFAGDSGDGMQVTGTQFTNATALAGNDLATLPDFPAEIRAPAGTLAGVSAFQLNFSSSDIFTPGDELDVLVAMNPAALRANLGDLRPGGLLVVDREGFTEHNLTKAGYETNPLENHSLAGYRVVPIDITRLTTAALKDLGLSARAVFRCRNFFSLGVMAWLYTRPTEPIENWIRHRFKGELVEANLRAFRAGLAFGENTELLPVAYQVQRAVIAPGTYRNITGNLATALGFVAAAQKAGRPLFLGSYPITPASDVLHELAALKQFDVHTFQAEDEIAGIGAALGAAFAGAIAITTTSGPGMNLKAETLGLALAIELPLVVTDIQRAGPSTGMPTKTEQADLLMAMYGRHGEAPVPILAAATPGDCFHMAFEAVRIAVKYMTPVVLLTDGYLANGSEPWPIPSVDQLADIPVRFRTDPTSFYPYLRDEETLARPWVIPGTPGLEHRVGGLEKDVLTGNVSYAPANHEQMVRLRARKIAGIAREVPPTEVFGPPDGELLLLGWGSTYGSIREATRQLQNEGLRVAHAHLRYLNPFPSDLGALLGRYRRVLVPEINLGQLVRLVRAEFLVPAVGFNKVQGRPFKVSEIAERARKLLRNERLEESAA